MSYVLPYTIAPMIQIDDILISRTVFQKKFVCDLSACKGACCVDGEGGAPLTDEEIEIISDNLEAIKPYADPKGQKVIELVAKGQQPKSSYDEVMECGELVILPGLINGHRTSF